MAPSTRTSKLLFAILTRLHFYVGLFIGPFILVAALSAIAYLLSPPLESWVYRDALTATSQVPEQPLADQVATAQRYLETDTLPSAVRPAPEPGATSRIMFSDETLGPSEHRAIFIDPGSLEVRGDTTVYGTSGILPLRTAIDHFHRQLLLGDTGRLYSELAASWLWIAALGGIVLWLWQRRSLKRAGPALATRRRHATIGAVIAVGLLFFSATGLTWSKWAGGNIGELRSAMNWGTPSVSTSLEQATTETSDPHAEHNHAGHSAAPMAMASSFALTDFDRALGAARAAGLDATRIQLAPPAASGQAWRVAEIDRRWPTQVDQVALHPQSMAVLDQTDFTTFPLAAKLTRWGVDLHMGVMFGLANQLVLAMIALGLVTLIFWGYRMAWRRLNAASGQRFPTVSEPWLKLPLGIKLVTALIAIALGFALPVMGVSLLAFAVVDALRWWGLSRKKLRSGKESLSQS
ncbi:PepSY-associated TM helix domain-containing protein [Halomonas dongshanensis]|uniref:PepSY domain-containing protein n=1 Tax=Halomonas dongshanensis TaxID=2890835 RepID=A0ABT2E9V7_9GAMM|nr:PepSY-associated TM helix domain-containing protein [Halomonas dongshanensis]MCS2608368.1 PepSY domain-containing protein [Halomonas dongshanensis]